MVSKWFRLVREKLLPAKKFRDRARSGPRREKTGERSKLTTVLTVLAAALAVVLLYSLLAGRLGMGTPVRAAPQAAGNAGTLVLNHKPSNGQSVMTTEEVAGRVCACVVGIVQYQQGAIGETGEGSGIVMSADGNIVTNNHVIEGANKLEVVMPDGTKYDASVVGSDARTDLAVIRIKASGLKYATFGDSDQCRVGEQVIAVGNPSGLQLAGSVTQGIISALNRNVDVGNGPMNLIQTDAAINPGNSGGALVNMYGQVVGINSAKIAQTGYEGLGFSIPVNTAKPVIDSILQVGYVQGRVKFGFSCKVIDSVTASLNHIPVGIYIGYVDPSSNAAKSGVKADDIITAVNGVTVKDTDTLITERDKHKPGDTVTLTLYRRSSGKQLSVPVTLLEDRGAGTSQAGGW